jgi:hypothetical protein
LKMLRTCRKWAPDAGSFPIPCRHRSCQRSGITLTANRSSREVLSLGARSGANRQLIFGLPLCAVLQQLLVLLPSFPSLDRR